MKISSHIDLEDVEVQDVEASGFDTLPEGAYRVMISSADYVDTSAGTGKRIPLELTVMSGEYTGRKIFEGLNVENPNDTAQRIGRQRLAELLDGIGIKRNSFKDTDQLEGEVVTAHVTRKMIKDPIQREQYGDKDGMQNGVKKFESAAMVSNSDATVDEASSDTPWN